jgi:hypothetical protein
MYITSLEEGEGGSLRFPVFTQNHRYFRSTHMKRILRCHIKWSVSQVGSFNITE